MINLEKQDELSNNPDLEQNETTPNPENDTDIVVLENIEDTKNDESTKYSYDIFLSNSKLASKPTLSYILCILIPLLLLATGFIFSFIFERFVLFMSCFITIFPFLLAIACITYLPVLSNSRKFAYIKTSDGKLFKVNLRAINNYERYRFTSKKVPLNVNKLKTNERISLANSLNLALTDKLSNTFFVPNDSVVFELKNAALTNETRHHYKISYITSYSTLTETKIYKIYDKFHPFTTITNETPKLPLNLPAFLITFFATLIPFAFIFALGSFVEGNHRTYAFDTSYDTRDYDYNEEHFHGEEYYNDYDNYGLYDDSSFKLDTYQNSIFSYQVPEDDIHIEGDNFVAYNSDEFYGVMSIENLNGVSPIDHFENIKDEAIIENSHISVSDSLEIYYTEDGTEVKRAELIIFNSSDTTTYIYIYAESSDMVIKLYSDTSYMHSANIYILADSIVFHDNPRFN